MPDKKRSLLVGLLLLLVWVMPVAHAGPKIESWLTSNGARVLFVQAPDLPMVSLRVVFDAGSAREKLSGVAMLTNALLEDGAGTWDAQQIAERLESVGAEISFASLRDMAYLSVRTLTEKRALDVAIETLSVVLGAPHFSDADLERSRKAMQFSVRRDEQSPGAVAKKAFYQSVFAGHPYAADPGGNHDSLAAITRQDVVDHYRRYYVAKNALVAIVGAVDRKQAERLAEQVTGQIPDGEAAPALVAVEPLSVAAEVKIKFPSSQSHILLGQTGMHRGDKDYFTLYVGNHILGGSGLISQLGEEVREKRGLSYSVYSYFSPMRQNGPFIVGAQTKNANVGEALSVMRETLRRFIEQGPSEAELTAAKRNITGGFPLRIASNSKIIGYLAMLGFYDLPLDYLDTFVGNVNAVTREQVIETFKRRLNPDKFVTIVVGNGAQATATK